MDSQQKSDGNPQTDHNRFIGAGKCSKFQKECGSGPVSTCLPRLQRGHRHIDLVHETGNLIFHSDIAVELRGKAMNKAGAKTAPGGFFDRRAAALGPCQFELFGLFIDR